MKPMKFIVIVALWLSIVLSVVLSILLPIAVIGYVNWGIFLEGFAVSFVVSFVLSLALPINVWGDKLAAACGRKPFSFSWHLISTAVATLVMATIMSMSMVGYFVGPHTGLSIGLFFAWVKAYPWVLLSIYVSSLIFAPIGVAIAKKLCGAPPMQASVAK